LTAKDYGEATEIPLSPRSIGTCRQGGEIALGGD
jgi:hypothetical protein